MTEQVFVSVQISGQPVEIGVAYFTRRAGNVSTSFRYHDEYLRRRDGYAVDPALPLSSGTHHRAGLPGAFQDGSPDRWGKNLIAKKLRAEALADHRTMPSVSDVDYLLGVSDQTRQGALRFHVEPGGPYLRAEPDVPKLVELPGLLRAADTVADDGEDDLAAVKLLLEAGTGSLGGARPKASVRDGDRLLIAKFPHHSDEWNVIAWECTALDLAERAGIDVPWHRLVDVGGQNVLLVERFDRRGEHRAGYLSAMTLLGGTDGIARDYTEIAETLLDIGSRTSDDLRQLWRRIAFSVAIHNTDDHLRNHGLLRDGPGWQLSPAFDINPNPDVGAHRVTGIGGGHTSDDEINGLVTYAASFDVSPALARAIVDDVLASTADWQKLADRNGIPASEQSRFRQSFDVQREPLLDGVAGLR